MKGCRNLLLAAIVTTVAGCVPPAREPPAQLTQLQTRQLQTREFPNETVIAAMKAVAAALQDGGFTIKQANTELGLITAERQVGDEDKATKSGQLFWYGPAALEYRTTRQWEASVNVQAIGDVIRVRASFVEKEINNKGAVTYSAAVVDPKFYQTFFSTIDKSVFLQKNKL